MAQRKPGIYGQRHGQRLPRYFSNARNLKPLSGGAILGFPGGQRGLQKRATVGGHRHPRQCRHCWHRGHCRHGHRRYCQALSRARGAPATPQSGNYRKRTGARHPSLSNYVTHNNVYPPTSGFIVSVFCAGIYIHDEKLLQYTIWLGMLRARARSLAGSDLGTGNRGNLKLCRAVQRMEADNHDSEAIC